MAEVKRVAYAWNSALEDQGENAYFLDCYFARDGQSIVDIHQSYKTKDEFYQAVEGLIPALEVKKDESRQDRVENEEWPRCGQGEALRLTEEAR